jgi:pyrimidine operon attenuation protein/uracil phosphoribosyltransferase
MSPAFNSANHSQFGATSDLDPAVDTPSHPATGTAASDVSGAPAPGQEHTPSRRAVILSEADIRRTLDRIAHQILESVGDAPVLLVGIPRRGVPLARRLAERMTRFAGGSYPVGALDITLFRDDLRGRPPRALAETQLPTTGVDGLTVVLVDDVLYSGRTIRAAMDALREHGRPAAIRLAVLVDRGHRQLPIRADYVGKNIPTAIDDDVAVQVTETDGVDAVTVERAI